MHTFIKTILAVIGAIFGFVLLYAFAAVALPYIEIPAKAADDPKVVDIYILSNGMHTDLVVPVKSAYFDWTTEIPTSDTRAGERNFQMVGIGWGDKGFYLDTPTWAELKVSTAIKAAFWMSSSAMHCTFLNVLPKNEESRKIQLTAAQYTALVSYIRAKFDRDSNGKVIFVKTDAVYGNDDSFYDAKGKYSFLNSCNTWTNTGLKVAGQKAALWTAGDWGIFQHYKK